MALIIDIRYHINRTRHRFNSMSLDFVTTVGLTIDFFKNHYVPNSWWQQVVATPPIVVFNLQEKLSSLFHVRFVRMNCKLKIIRKINHFATVPFHKQVLLLKTFLYLLTEIFVFCRCGVMNGNAFGPRQITQKRCVDHWGVNMNQWVGYQICLSLTP